jgi:tetratricopeptide (TPR) repeat protein
MSELDSSEEGQGVCNEISGTVLGNAIQAKIISGGVHIHASDTQGRRQPPRQLPAVTPNFIGRNNEIAQLEAIVSVCTIDGVAGAGKTTLALHWARKVSHRFVDGQLYANLRGFDLSAEAADPSDILQDFLESLGIPVDQIPNTLEARASLYRSLLDQANAIVVLDNAISSEQVRPLLPGHPSCKVVITSRKRLDGLITREGALRITVGNLQASEGVDLIRSYIGRERVDSQIESATELVQLCARLPLALSLVAARAAVNQNLTLAELVEELQTENNPLDRFESTEDITLDIRTVFSWSYRSLSAAGARVFRLLSLHPGPDLSLPASASLAGITVRQARTITNELVAANLIENHLPKRFRFHDLIQDYANELVRDDNDLERAVNSLLDWYITHVDLADHIIDPIEREGLGSGQFDSSALIDFATHEQAIEWLEIERSNLLSIARIAVRLNINAYVYNLALALNSFFSLRNRVGEWIYVQKLSVEALRQINEPAVLAANLTNLGTAYCRGGRFDDALLCLEESLELRRSVGDKYGEAMTLTNIGSVHKDCSRIDVAQDYYRQALEVCGEFDQSAQSAAKAIILNNLGDTYRLQMKFSEAKKVTTEALGLYQQSGDRYGETLALQNLGLIYTQQEDFRQGASFFRRAADLSREMRNQYSEGVALDGLAVIALFMNDYETAEEYWSQALAILAGVDDIKASEIDGKLAALKFMTQ